MSEKITVQSDQISIKDEKNEDERFDPENQSDLESNPVPESHVIDYPITSPSLIPKKDHSNTDEKDSFLTEGPKLDKYLKEIRLKDHGHPWIIVIAMLVSNTITAGYVKSFGIMYNEIIVEYPNTTSATAGLMMGLLAGCRSIFAPVAGALAIKFGSRTAITIGTVLCVVGLTVSYFATSIVQLAFTLGAMMGIGICLIETCQVIVVTSFFEEKLSLANGLRVSGNTIGGMVFPFLVNYLLEDYGVCNTRIVLGAIFLHILICMILIRSPETHKRILIINAIKKVNKNSTTRVTKEEEKQTYILILKTFQDNKTTSKKKLLEFRYFKNAVYYVFIISTVFVSLALPFVIYYIPQYGKSLNLSGKEISLLLAVQSLLDLIYRIGLGFVSDLKFYKKIHGLIFCLIVGGIGAIAIPFCKEDWILFVLIAVFTLGSAGYYSFMNVVLAEQFGRSSIVTTWGFVRMVQGITNMAGSSILGAIYDANQTYVPVFAVMGGGMLLSGCLLILEPLVIKMTKAVIIIT